MRDYKSRLSISFSKKKKKISYDEMLKGEGGLGKSNDRWHWGGGGSKNANSVLMSVMNDP